MIRDHVSILLSRDFTLVPRFIQLLISHSIITRFQSTFQHWPCYSNCVGVYVYVCLFVCLFVSFAHVSLHVQCREIILPQVPSPPLGVWDLFYIDFRSTPTGPQCLGIPLEGYGSQGGSKVSQRLELYICRQKISKDRYRLLVGDVLDRNVLSSEIDRQKDVYKYLDCS